MLLKCGASVDLGAKNVRRMYGYEDGTALMFACEHGHNDIVSMLLKYGASVDLGDEEGTTALMYACEHGHNDIVSMLLKCGASVDMQNDYYWEKNVDRKDRRSWAKMYRRWYNPGYGETALMIATEHSHVEIVNLLLDYGANIDLQDMLKERVFRGGNFGGSTALKIAILNDDENMTRLLLDRGANGAIEPYLYNFHDEDWRIEETAPFIIAFDRYLSSGNDNIIRILLINNTKILYNYNITKREYPYAEYPFINDIKRIRIDHINRVYPGIYSE
jgi:ankyrin repeat protein